MIPGTASCSTIDCPRPGRVEIRFIGEGCTWTGRSCEDSAHVQRLVDTAHQLHLVEVEEVSA